MLNFENIDVPLPDPCRFERDFAREFGAGDEKQVEQVDIYQGWDDSGHGRGDFA